MIILQNVRVNLKTAWYIHYTYLGGASHTPNCFDAYNFQLSGVKLFDLEICWPNLAFWIVLHQAACSIICICRIILAGGWDMQWKVQCLWLHSSEQWLEYQCQDQCFIRCQQLQCHPGLSKCTQYFTKFCLLHQCYCLYWHQWHYM